MKQDFLSVDFSGFQPLQDLKHEFLVDCILLGIEMYSDTIETHKVSGGFEQGEEFPKARQKVRIQEFGNNGDLNILWQLFEEIFILFITDS